MSIIEQATKRLEELRRGGVDVPWSAAGLSEDRFNQLLGHPPAAGDAGASAVALPAAPSAALPLPAAAMQRAAGGARETPTPASPTRLARAAPARSAAPSVEIDLARLAREGYLAPDQVRSDLALEFRHIKRPLLANAADRLEGSRNSLIMVTSALPGEGKTFCAVNLAMSMAMEVDTSVLLVDADVIRPTVLDRLGLQSARGFLDVLTDDRLDLAEVILRTNVPKLSILPAGTRNDRSSELLASGAMDRLLLELATRYPDRIVILDAPPLLLTSESRVLASHVGQVVVVVDSENTTTSKVAQAFAAVEDCPLVMSILNKCVEPEHRHGYYGYEYR
jgi:protein-tyrosine kinase